MSTASKPGNIRTLNLLRDAWERQYGRAFRGGLLSYAIVPDLVRGLAFLQLAAQDDETDANVVLKRLETAVLDLLAELSPALAETRKGA